jgi:hypothetical protein
MSWGREPFLSPWPLLAVVVFALNNFWWKWVYPGWLVGKQSDVCACFFLPLYVAWVLAEIGARSWPLQRRVQWGVGITVVVFTFVKTTTPGSQLLNTLVDTLTAGLPLSLAPNRVDPSDLIALPMAWIAARFAKGMQSEVAHPPVEAS